MTVVPPWEIDFHLVKDILEALSYVATIVGIPIAIAVFIADRRKEQRHRARETFVEANARYIDYLRMCIENPELSCSEVAPSDPRLHKTGLDAKTLNGFAILISNLETGYVLYDEQRHSKQWKGWHDYMVMWVRRSDFQKAWSVIGHFFDADFVAYVDALLRDARRHASRPQ